MAKHTRKPSKKEMEGKETVEVFRGLDKTALDAEQFLEKHSKTLIGIFVGLVLIVLGYFAFQQFYVLPRNNEATMGYLAAQKIWHLVEKLLQIQVTSELTTNIQERPLENFRHTMQVF